MGRLDGKVAIITGSTSGMGRDTAYLFAKEGAKVVVTGRNEARAKQVVDNIKALGFKFATRGAITVSISDIVVPEAKRSLLESADERGKVIEANYRDGMISDNERCRDWDPTDPDPRNPWLSEDAYTEETVELIDLIDETEIIPVDERLPEEDIPA